MLKAIFPSQTREISLFGLTQWDKGQQLSVSFENMPDKFQLHFSSRGSNQAVVVDAVTKNGEAIADIPDELLTSSSDILVWIYLCGNEDEGETVGKITLYVKSRARPKGYLEDLVPSQQKIVESMIKDMKDNLAFVMKNGVDAQYVPDYVKSEARRVAKNVLSCQNSKTVSFIAVSDMLYDSEDYYTKQGLRHMSQAMKIIRSMCDIDFAVSLGGMTKGGTDKNTGDGKNDILAVNELLWDALSGLPCFRTVGTDDMLGDAFYRNGTYIKNQELYNYIGKWCSGAVFNSEDISAGYCYRDFEKQKIRVICLNTSDFKSDEVVTPATDRAKISPLQLKWICSALDMSDKSDTSSWGIILLSHYPLNWYSNFSALIDILQAYLTGKSVDLLMADSVQISYNFRGKNSAALLAQFHGHLRNFKVNSVSKLYLPLICIPNACFAENNIYADDKYTAEERLLYSEDATWNKTAESEDDTAFCVVTIDTAEGKIYSHCYGAGYDRETDFEAIVTLPDETPDSGGGSSSGDDSSDDDGGDSSGNESYTNVISQAVDINNTVYNQKGYMNSYRLNSSGEVSACDGFTHTGYIALSAADTLRVKGCNCTELTGNFIIAYDSSFNIVWVCALDGNDNSAAGVSYIGGILTFTPVGVTNGNLGNMAYVRLSCEGNGDTLIITRNEQITADDTSGSDPDTPPAGDYTNIIPYSIDDFNEPYNGGLGYMDGFKLDEFGMVDESEAADGFTHTGYIYAEKGSVLRFKGCNFTGGEGNYLIVFDSEMMHLFTVEVLDATDDAANGISFSGGVMTFNSSAVTSEEIPDSFYVRISTMGEGANLVATYNEEIE